MKVLVASGEKQVLRLTTPTLKYAWGPLSLRMTAVILV